MSTIGPFDVPNLTFCSKKNSGIMVIFHWKVTPPKIMIRLMWFTPALAANHLSLSISFIFCVHLNMRDNYQYCLCAKEIMIKCVISAFCKQSIYLTFSKTMFYVHAILRHSFPSYFIFRKRLCAGSRDGILCYLFIYHYSILAICMSFSSINAIFSGLSGKFPDRLDIFRMICKVSG